MRRMRDTDTESRSGLTVPCTRDSGKKTKPMGGEDSFMLTEMCMRENGRTIRPMAKESTSILMELSTTVSGKRTSKTEMV